MRILIGVHQFFPHHYTGTERYVLNICKQLQKMGHFVKVLTYSIIDNIDFKKGLKMLYKEYVFEGIPVIALKHNDIPNDYSFCFELINDDLYNEVVNIIKKDEFDIYHCAHPFRISASIKAAKDCGLKVVFMATDYWLMCPLGIMLRTDKVLCDGPDKGQNCLKFCFSHVDTYEIEKRIKDSYNLINSCDCLLSPSNFLIWLFDNAKYIDKERFILSRHGLDYTKRKLNFKRVPNGNIVFGYIGTIQQHKGVHVMIEGFKRTKHKNIKLQVWGGCFNENEYYQNLINTSKEDPRIEFKGVYDFNDISKILENIDVVIVPSIWYENAPLTISTSLAYLTPVITSNIGGMAEMIKDGHNGLTFKVGDADDLSERISLIASNPELISKFKSNIQYPIRIEEEAFNTEQIYRSLLDIDN